MLGIVDIQFCFTKDNEKIVKQICLYNLLTSEKRNYIFLPPVGAKLDNGAIRKNTWLQKYHHGLGFKSGEIHYTFLKDVLSILGKYLVLLVKGEEKKEFLQLNTNSSIIELSYYNCPSIKYLKKQYCEHNNNNKFTYSENIIKALRAWLSEKNEYF